MAIDARPFCADVHTTMLHGGKEHTLASRILRGDLETVPPSKTRNIVEWAMETGTPHSDLLHSPPFSMEEAPSIIGTAVAFHYINRMVNVFLDESPIVVPSFLKWLKGPIGRLAGWLVGKRIMTVKPGESLRFLPG